MAGITAALSAIAKSVYPKDLPKAFYLQNPALQDVVRKTGQGGDFYKMTVEISQGAKGSATYADATAVAGLNQYARFSVPFVSEYSIARMNNQDLKQLQGNDNALVDAWKDAIDGAYQEVNRAMAIQLFRSGTGSRGQISSGSTVSTATITLSTISDITNFAVGMVLVASTADGGVTRNSSANETIAGLDRSLGTMTSTSAAWNTVIGALAATDYLYRRGDAQNNASAPITFTGAGAWLVGGASPAALHGATRTVDPVALAGTAVDYTTVALEDAVIDLASKVASQDPSKKSLYVNPRMKASLVKTLETKTRFIRPTQGAGAVVGFDGIEFETDAGPMALKGDINVPMNQFFILADGKTELVSCDKLPDIIDTDGQKVRFRDSIDQVEMRLGGYGNFVFRFPGACGRGYNWGL